MNLTVAMLAPAVAAILGGLLLLLRKPPPARLPAGLTQLLNESEWLRKLIETIPGRLDGLSDAVAAMPEAIRKDTKDSTTIEALLIALREAQEGALYRLLRAHIRVAEDRLDRDDPAHRDRDWAYIDQLLGPRPQDWPQ